MHRPGDFCGPHDNNRNRSGTLHYTDETTSNIFPFLAISATILIDTICVIKIKWEMCCKI